MASSGDISCLCGGSSQKVQLLRFPHGERDVSLCHCDVCRYTSGLLCVSYRPIRRPDVLNSTSKHQSPDGWARYFCATCGCHIFRMKNDGDANEEWEVATGVIKAEPGDGPAAALRYADHVGVPDTKDGGSSVWLGEYDGEPMKFAAESASQGHGTQNISPPPVQSSNERLPAACGCGRVSFHITRPDAESYKPHSGLPDLMYAYCTTDAEFVRNPSDRKWWICSGGTKYLAGTCACRSCRLFSGFEIQVWAFVPRTNIFFHVRGENGQPTVVPLDFAALPKGTLTSYESSAGVLREFCGTCGATVFWHDKWRPDVIDVSVGLLRAEEGARAESWLEWWTQRVSFSEDAENDRVGSTARTARGLVEALENGLGRWKQGQ